MQALAAAAVMAQNQNPCQPRSMTLMAGPVDVRNNPTAVNELATAREFGWFESRMISLAPYRYGGGGRRVYPGFLQLAAFMSMNIERHVKAHHRLYEHLARGETEKAETIKRFYDEYFAVLDLTAEFHLETVSKVFQQAQLARGELTFDGVRVNPAAIRRTNPLTVEGERDDICAVGQISAAHSLCSGLRPHQKRHHLQADVGHYGVFKSKRWERQIYPIVRNLTLSSE